MTHYVEHDPRGCSEGMQQAAEQLNRDTGATVEIARWNIWRVEGIPLLTLTEWLDNEGFQPEVYAIRSNPVTLTDRRN